MYWLGKNWRFQIDKSGLSWHRLHGLWKGAKITAKTRDLKRCSLHRKDLSSDGLVDLDSAFDVDGDAVLKAPFKELAQHMFSNIAALGVIEKVSKK